MSLRLDHDDPEAMSPEERRDEVASILSLALLRMPRGARIAPAPAQIPAESPQPGLEVSAHPRPDRGRG